MLGQNLTLTPLSVAPMVDYTDRHCRHILRLVSPKALLYSEMIVAQAIVHGNADRLLAFDDSQHPLVAQLAGNDPNLLAKSAEIVEEKGFDGINLNIGCPSPRVKQGGFGAILMESPDLVGTLVTSMRQACHLPISVKCRIGTDLDETYDTLRMFVDVLVRAKVSSVVVHARIANLSGYSTAQNLTVPPLKYGVVRKLQNDYPALPLVVNGGLKSTHDVMDKLKWANGVMVGRTAYRRPDVLAHMHASVYGTSGSYSPFEIVDEYLPYVRRELESGTPLRALTRHLLNLFHGYPGAKNFRRHLSKFAIVPGANENVLLDAIANVSSVPQNV